MAYEPSIQVGGAVTNADGVAEVLFARAFASVPRVFCQPRGESLTVPVMCKVLDRSPTGFKVILLKIQNGSVSTAVNQTFDWLALRQV